MSEKRYYGRTKLELSWKKTLEKDIGMTLAFHYYMQSLILGRFSGSGAIIFMIKSSMSLSPIFATISLISTYTFFPSPS